VPLAVLWPETARDDPPLVSTRLLALASLFSFSPSRGECRFRDIVTVDRYVSGCSVPSGSLFHRDFLGTDGVVNLVELLVMRDGKVIP